MLMQVLVVMVVVAVVAAALVLLVVLLSFRSVSSAQSAGAVVRRLTPTILKIRDATSAPALGALLVLALAFTLEMVAITLGLVVMESAALLAARWILTGEMALR